MCVSCQPETRSNTIQANKITLKKMAHFISRVYFSRFIRFDIESKDKRKHLEPLRLKGEGPKSYPGFTQPCGEAFPTIRFKICTLAV